MEGAAAPAEHHRHCAHQLEDAAAARGPRSAPVGMDATLDMLTPNWWTLALLGFTAPRTQSTDCQGLPFDPDEG